VSSSLTRSPVSALHWTAARYVCCVMCRRYVEARAARNVQAIGLVAASLHRPAASARQAADKARDPRGLPASEVSTAHTVLTTEVRAARAQCDTHGG
jgi:hypothetical protein